MKTYHESTFRTIKEIPVVSAEACLLVRNLDKRCDGKLAESVKEWYSYLRAIPILSSYSNCDHPIALAELGEPFGDWYGTGPRDFVAEGYLVFMHENQGVCNWAIPLDGRNDPPVLVAFDSAPNAVWLPCADSFSDFVNTIVSNFNHSLMLCAQAKELNSVDLEFLRQSFTIGFQTHNFPGKENYRFSAADQYILIWNSDGQADWHLQSDSAAGLTALVDRVYKCSDVFESLYANDEIGSQILRNKRAR